VPGLEFVELESMQGAQSAAEAGAGADVSGSLHSALCAFAEALSSDFKVCGIGKSVVTMVASIMAPSK
jgi:hypothetical protein